MYYTMKLSDPATTAEDKQYCMDKANHWDKIHKELSVMIEELKNRKDYE